MEGTRHADNERTATYDLPHPKITLQLEASQVADDWCSVLT